MSEWFERFGGSSLRHGKNEPVSELRAAVRIVNETLAELNVEQHPDKTFLGRIERGFDFLGSVMKPAGLEMAPRAIEHCVERVSRLDEQGADLIRIGAYLKRWYSWAKS